MTTTITFDPAPWQFALSKALPELRRDHAVSQANVPMEQRTAFVEPSVAEFVQRSVAKAEVQHQRARKQDAIQRLGKLDAGELAALAEQTEATSA